jgi:predicted acyltransferase
MGNLTGIWLLSKRATSKKIQGIAYAGIIAAITGWLWGLWFPINKALWTSSFVLWTGGLALLLFALCYWLIEVKHRRSWSKPFEIFGTNALAAYFLHMLFLKIQNLIHLSNADGTIVNLRIYLSQHLFGWTSMQMASLFYALSYTFLWFIVVWVLYRYRIFIKI